MERKPLKISIRKINQKDSTLCGFHGILYSDDEKTILKEKFDFSKHWIVNVLGNYAKEFNDEKENGQEQTTLTKKKNKE